MIRDVITKCPEMVLGLSCNTVQQEGTKDSTGDKVGMKRFQLWTHKCRGWKGGGLEVHSLEKCNSSGMMAHAPLMCRTNVSCVVVGLVFPYAQENHMKWVYVKCAIFITLSFLDPCSLLRSSPSLLLLQPPVWGWWSRGMLNQPSLGMNELG